MARVWKGTIHGGIKEQTLVACGAILSFFIYCTHNVTTLLPRAPNIHSNVDELRFYSQQERQHYDSSLVNASSEDSLLQNFKADDKEQASQS